ncbi:MFS transporter [Leptolyngbya sp. AN02str]|uniref:MFS transporter n=1 Tax=Leptolyngbya sp. AN02str TaxID=3423363 RepID=UPI003D31F74E
MLWVRGVITKRVSATVDRERLIQFALLLIAGCLTTMTGGLVSPVFPEMVQELQLDPRWAGTLVSIHALTSALATPVMGLLADRIGKLKVMLPCLLLYAVFGISTTFLTNFQALVASRALLGIASGGVAAATIGFLGSMYEGEERSRILGLATSAMTTAAIMFPLIGGRVGNVEWRHAYYLYAISIPVAIASLFMFRNQPKRTSSLLDTQQKGDLVNVIRQPEVLRLYLLIGAAATVVYAIVIYTPLYLKAAIGADPELNGMILAIRAVGAAMTSALAASWLAKQLGEKRAIALGFSLMAVTILLIPFLTQLTFIVPTAILFGIGFGVVTPNLYNALASQTPAQFRTTVLGLGTGFNSLGQFICPLLLGPVWKYGDLTYVFVAATAIAAIASLLSLTQFQKPQI